MKKLLITLFSAASAMMVATAAETQRGDIESFETRTVGAFDPSVDDNGQAVGPFLWARDDGTEGNSAADSTIEAYAEQHSTYGSNYLKVDESGTLRRKFANAENTQSDTVTLANEGEGVYVNTRVQFTASEDDVTPDATDKLIIWLKETVADETTGIAASTNLMIAATDAANIMGNTAQINYVVVNENISVVPGEWYDLKITAVRGAADARAPVFTVSLNGIKLKAVPSDNPTVTPVEEFASLTARDLNALWEFTSVGFKGNGAIDHIEMGTSVKDAAKNYQVGNAFFEDFTAALAAAQGAYSTESGAATVKLLTGVTAPDSITIDSNPVIIDLNGQTITSEASTIVASKNVTIIDSVGDGRVETTGEEYCLFADDTAGATITIGKSAADANIVCVGKTYGAIKVYGGKYTDISGTFTSMVENMEMSTEPKEDGYYQLVSTGGTVTYRTLTIPEVANATATVYDSEAKVITDLTKIADGATVTVRWVASSSDYKITAGAEEVITMNADKTATSPTVVSTQASYPSYIPEGSTETKTAFDTWVANKASGDRDTAGANMDAFLLNVAPGAAATEKTNFKITAITVNADSTVTVTTTTANSNDEPYNGKVVVKGKVDLTDADWVEKKDTHKFFKAFLEIK